MDKLSILIVIDSLGSGGAEKSTQVLCDFLAKERVPFEIICLDRRNVGVEHYMISKGYKIHFIDKLSFLQQVNFIAEFIKKEKFKIVHSILFRSNLRVRLSKTKVNFIHLESLVSTPYSKQRLLDPSVNKNGVYVYRIIDRLTANRFVNHFHSITEAVKQHYVEHLKLPEEKISVILRGRSAEKKEDVVMKSEFGFHENDFVVVNTGRHEYTKGQIQLIKAIKELADNGYSNIKLLILGREGGCTSTMQSFIHQHNLEELVCLAGYRNDVPEVLRACNIFAFPSYHEGLGGAVIEAQAAGLPVICNKIEVMNEVVVEGENAEFFMSDNVSSIAEKILFFYSRPEITAKYGEKSRENFEAKFEIEAIHEKMLQLYRSLCAEDGNVL